MRVFYNTADGQVQALYDGDTTSSAWAAFSSVTTSNAAHIASLRQYGRDCRVTVVADAITAVTPYDHPVDHSLAANKVLRCRTVDIKTAKLRATGFEHPSASGAWFSLTERAQIKVSAIAKMGAGRFPHSVSRLDDVKYNIPDTAAADSFRTAMVTRLHKQILGPGSDLKDDIMAAANQTVLDAIVDSRT